MCKTCGKDKNGVFKATTGVFAGGLLAFRGFERIFRMGLKWLKRCVLRHSVQPIEYSISVDTSQAESSLAALKTHLDAIVATLREVENHPAAGVWIKGSTETTAADVNDCDTESFVKLLRLAANKQTSEREYVYEEIAWMLRTVLWRDEANQRWIIDDRNLATNPRLYKMITKKAGESC